MYVYEDEWVDKENIYRECYSAEEQVWDKEALERLWESHNIVFDGHGIKPIKIIGKDSTNPIIAFGSEDDGTIQFERDYYGGEEPSNYRFSCSAYWIDSIIEHLQEVKRRLKE